MSSKLPRRAHDSQSLTSQMVLRPEYLLKLIMIIFMVVHNAFFNLGYDYLSLIKLVLVLNQKYRKNRNFCILVLKISSSLGSSQFRFQYQSFRFHLIWGQNGAKMEPKWNRTSTKMRQMQITPWKPCTETLVSRIRNQNRGTRTGTVEPQEPRLQYRNRDWTEKSGPYQHYYKSFSSAFYIVILISRPIAWSCHWFVQMISTENIKYDLFTVYLTTTSNYILIGSTQLNSAFRTHKK